MRGAAEKEEAKIAPYENTSSQRSSIKQTQLQHIIAIERRNGNNQHMNGLSISTTSADMNGIDRSALSTISPYFFI